MNYDILGPILIISAISIGAGLLLNRFNGSDKYDERQLIERGRGANLAMVTAIVYMLGLYAGYLFDLLRVEYMAIFAIYGLSITVLIHSGYCIFHDAYLIQEEDLGPEVLRNAVLGGVWMALAFFNGNRDIQSAWIDSALALSYLSESLLLLVYALILRIRDRRTAKEDPDE